MSATTDELRELRAIVSCVRVVLYGDVCEDAPCEDDECNACRSSARVDAYFRPTVGTVTEGAGLGTHAGPATVPPDRLRGAAVHCTVLDEAEGTTRDADG